MQDTDFRNDRVITVYGMKRTGNHGIITWINHLFDAPVYFINNVRHFTDPFAKNHEFRRHKHSNAVDLHKNRYPDDVFSTEIREMRKEVLLLSYEDLELSALDAQPLIEDRDARIGGSRKETGVLLLRDHYNLIASRMQMYLKEGSSVTEARMSRDLDLWKSYAREFLGETDHIKAAPLIRISYNDWFISEAYRRELAGTLERPFSDAGLEIMPPQGSSFDGNSMSGQAQQMKVLDRWRAMLDNEVYAAVIRDEEAAELSRRIFDFAPNLAE